MYSKRETSQLRHNFWTLFGQYMRPVLSADDQSVNWVNYKTGVKHIYFRMDATDKRATLAIELRHPDVSRQKLYFEKFKEFESLFRQTTGENWQWQMIVTDEDGKPVSRISTHLDGVNVLNSSDWAAMISFLKPRIIALDRFWNLVKEEFET